MSGNNANKFGSENFDPLDLRAQEKALADNSERNKLTLLTEQEDFKWLMGNKRGRRIVWRLLERTGVYRSSFTGNSETFFREGMRNVGLALLDQVHTITPDQFAVMLKEQKESKDDR
jgi:hypothetical protein